MEQVKLLLCIIFISAVLFTVTACEQIESYATTSDIMSKVRTAIPEKEMIDGIVYLEAGNLYSSDSNSESGTMPDEIISEIYRSDFDMVENYSIWIAEDNVVTEIGIFKLNDSANVSKFVDILYARIEELKIKASSIRNEEMTKAENAVISSTGKYVYYLVTNINSILEDIIINEIAMNQITE